MRLPVEQDCNKHVGSNPTPPKFYNLSSAKLALHLQSCIWEKHIVSLNLKDLIQNILTEHHVLLRRELPRLELLLGEIISEFGAQNQKLCEAFETFKKVKAKIEIHLGDEEQFLFPACLKLENGEAADQIGDEVKAGPNLLDRLVEMESEHENSGKAFEAILIVVNSIAVDEERADGLCHQFITGLAAVIADLKVHVQKENDQVHPRARQLLSIVYP